jgi:hypothetical protein
MLKIDGIEYHCSSFKFFETSCDRLTRTWEFFAGLLGDEQTFARNILEKQAIGQELPLEYVYTDYISPSIKRSLKGWITIETWDIHRHFATAYGETEYHHSEIRLKGTIKIAELQTIVECL